MRKIILMSGIPGSGKSYEAQKRISAHIRDSYPFPSPENFTITSDPVSRPIRPGDGWKTSSPIIHLSTDDHFMRGSSYKFDVNLLNEAHGSCLKNYIRGVQDTLNELLIVDNTMTTNEELAPYIAIAQAYRVPVEVITMVVLPHEVEKAAARNVHGVSSTSVRRMWENLLRSGEQQFPFHWSSLFGVTFTSIPAVFM